MTSENKAEVQQEVPTVPAAQEPVMVPKLVNVVVTSDLGTGRVRIVFDKDVQFVEFGHDQARTFITETKAHTRRAAAASAAAYQGDRAEALWCFDEETARATEAYYARMRGKKAQQVDFVQAGQFTPISTSHAGVELKFQPLTDGVTFHLGADFIAPLPPKPPIAAKDKPPPPTTVTPLAASPGSHGSGEVAITRITGAVAKVDAGTWRIALNRIASTTDRRSADIWLLAETPGDGGFKSAVQQAVLHVPANNAGADQRIAFDEIPDQKAGVKSLGLHATSSAGTGAKVCFYVREGPAEVDDDTLRFAPIPPRAKFPVKVTVVAWQLGRATEPMLKAAAPAERTFLLR